jgi:hypothetical protein
MSHLKYSFNSPSLSLSLSRDEEVELPHFLQQFPERLFSRREIEDTEEAGNRQNE